MEHSPRSRYARIDRKIDEARNRWRRTGRERQRVLVAEGGRFGGYSLYLKKGKLVLYYNSLNSDRYTITSNADVPLGKSTLRYEFTAPNKARGGGSRSDLSKPI
jgi:hypothetical protein